MSDTTTISWCDHTFNPWIGCTKVSEGCRFCYAEQFATKRMGLKVWGPGADRHTTKTWVQVPRWNRAAMAAGERRRVFCASLADVFEDHTTANQLRPKLWDLIRCCDSLDWLLLTKRPGNITAMLPGDWGDGWPQVWIGATVEDARVAHRLDALRSIPAAVRFVSYEPALGPLHDCNLSGIDWVIYGGESGPGYRPDDRVWARAMRDRCQADDRAFFYKQAAGVRPGRDVLLDGVEIKQLPIPRFAKTLKGGAQ